MYKQHRLPTNDYTKRHNMELYEYQIKNYLEDADIPVPERQIVTSTDSIRQTTGEVTGLVLLKPQSHRETTGTWINTAYEDPATAIKDIFAHDYFETIRSILVEKIYPFEHYLYVEFRTGKRFGKVRLSVTNIQQRPSYPGIEHINPFIGLRAYQARKIATDIELPERHVQSFIDTLQKLFQFYVANDAEHMTLNPLGINRHSVFTVLKTGMRIDDNALYRQKKFMMLQLLENPAPPLATARKSDITLIDLHGDIGCVANGSGLSVAVLDEMKSAGLAAGTILDIGSMASSEKLQKAVAIALQQNDRVVISMFGHLVSCETIAYSLLQKLTDPTMTGKHVYLHLAGIGAEMAVAMLTERSALNIHASTSLKEIVAVLAAHSN
ncbi:MAG: ATP-grasp domain-containing protein [Chloroflexota bacterium]